MPPVEPYYVKEKNLYIVPVCHYRMEFALCVHKAMEEIKPDCVAVELPSTLELHIKEAVERFPYLSVIFYENGQGDFVYFPIEPADPMAEAMRWGMEKKIPVHCIDLDTDDYPLIFDPMPDSYAVHCLGLKEYHQTYKEVVESGGKPPIATPHDEMREMGMAHHLQELTSRHKKVLLVCGMSHVSGILDKIRKPSAIPIGKVVRKDLRLFNLSLDSIREVTGENPFVISTYEVQRGSHDVEKEIAEILPGTETANPDTLYKQKGRAEVVSFSDFKRAKEKERGIIPEEPPQKNRKDAAILLQNKSDDGNIEFTLDSIVNNSPATDSPVDSFGTKQSGFTGISSKGNRSDKITRQKTGEIPGIIPVTPEIGLIPHGKEKTTEDEKARNVFNNFMKKIFSKLFDKSEKNIIKSGFTLKEEKNFFDDWLDGFEENAPIERENIHKFNTSEDRRDELLRFYDNLSKQQPDFDRQVFILEMLKQAAKYYQENVNEEIKRWQLRVFMKFAHNWASLTGMLLPDPYQMIVSARSCADDNFAYEVWDLLTYYPWLDHSGKYETIDIRADEVWLNGKKIMLRRKFPHLRKRLMRVNMKERKKERTPGEWAEKYDGNWICSYPPEDIVIEDYGTYLRRKGMSILKEENSRILPFTTSLLDGVDIRETMRNWHEKKLYVKEEVQISGGVGSIVVIFDEDRENEKFPWKLTWLGEHYQESDMAFYSTHPAKKIVGPGISRCEYGGFMMTYPPKRMWDVWSDPVYSMAECKSEVLLMAAIEYSIEKHVVYVGVKPPRSWFKGFANRLGKSLIYIPAGKMSPVTLKKIRVFHVLSGYQLREIAKDYVW